MTVLEAIRRGDASGHPAHLPSGNDEGERRKGQLHESHGYPRELDRSRGGHDIEPGIAEEQRARERSGHRHARQASVEAPTRRRQPDQLEDVEPRPDEPEMVGRVLGRERVAQDHDQG